MIDSPIPIPALQHQPDWLLNLKGGYFINRPCRTSSHFFTNRMMTLAIPSDTRYFCERFHVLRPLKLLHLLT